MANSTANSAVLFFRPAGDVGPAELGPALSRAMARIAARAPRLTVRGAVDAGLLGGQTEHAQETAAGPGFTAVLHVSLAGDGDLPVGDGDLAGDGDLPAGDGDLLTGAVRGIAADLGPLIDPARSAALAGAEHVIVPGEQPLMLAMAIRRLPSLTHEQYVGHWSTAHAELGRAVPGSQGYRQVRAVAPLSRQVAAAAGVGVADLDGVALAYYADEQAFFAIMGNAEVTGPLLADEQTFIDHARSALVCGWAQRPPGG
jgi:EthD domain-containing protein